MNREILTSMDTSHIPVQRLTALLETFTLKHAARMLPDLLETADLQDSSCREFLLAVLETEVKGRNERRRKRNYSAAHFPPNIRPLEEFDPEELESGITQAQLSVLKELSWLDNCGNLVFAGPPGLGKTMVACGLGLQAVNSGYTVCVFCQVLFPKKSVGIPFFQQGIFPAFSGHYASLRMRACSIR